MTDWKQEDIELYSKQFDNLKKLIGKRVDKLFVFLDHSDSDYSEQPNRFGKSLFNGIDLIVGEVCFSIGNRFIDQNHGLKIDVGETNNFEFIEESKNKIEFNELKTKGQIIKYAKIFWMKIPWQRAVGFYPQEIELITENGTLLFSSIEINGEEANTEFTDELLLIESDLFAKELKIGKYGLMVNDRYCFDNFDELVEIDKTTWL